MIAAQENSHSCRSKNHRGSAEPGICSEGWGMFPELMPETDLHGLENSFKAASPIQRQSSFKLPGCHFQISLPLYYWTWALLGDFNWGSLNGLELKYPKALKSAFMITLGFTHNEG